MKTKFAPLENRMESPSDRDFFQTKEGLFFCVTGHLHPQDRITAYLKYVPAENGKWQGQNSSFARQLEFYHARNVAKTLDFLRKEYPDYISHCPIRDFEFSLVPKDALTHYYCPKKRLSMIMENPGDPLEEETRDLVRRLSSATGVPEKDFGITGSILIGLHNMEWSDIDLLVYGKSNSLLVRQALLKGDVKGIKAGDEDRLGNWARRVSQRFPLSYDDALNIAVKRWNYGFFKGRYFSIHPVRNQVTEKYGDHYYRNVGHAKIRGVVTRSDESVFLPASYEIDNVRCVKDPILGSMIREIVSFEGLFCDIADPGQEIEAQGSIETVDGLPQRLVIGTSGQACPEYIRILN
jgi:hypothetical protein